MAPLIEKSESVLAAHTDTERKLTGAITLKPSAGPPSLFASLFAVCAFAILAAYAHATELPVAGDAHVNSTRTTTNFGYLSNLYVGNGNTAFLQFDLSGLPSGITPSQIASAKVTVFVIA